MYRVKQCLTFAGLYVFMHVFMPGRFAQLTRCVINKS